MQGKITIVTSMYNKNAEVLEILDKLFFPSLLFNGCRNENGKNSGIKDTGLIIIDDCSPLKVETMNLFNKYLYRLLGVFAFVKFVRNKENLGFSKSYNKGINLVKTKYILVTNDDLYFPPGSIKRLFQALDEPANYGLVGPIANNSTLWSYQYAKQAPRLRSYEQKEIDRLKNFSIWLEKNMKGQRITTDHHLCGFCFAAKTEFLKEFNGFDESYSFGQFEDTDLVRRVIKKYGPKKIAIIMDVFVGHGGINGNSRTLLQEPQKMIFYAIFNGIKYLKKWGLKAYLKILLFGIRSQTTGKGTISELLPKEVNF
jgi:GT2 family glycosyltransferase